MINTLIEKYLNADVTSQAFIEAQEELQAYMGDKGIENLKMSNVGGDKFEVTYVLPVADTPFGDNLDEEEETELDFDGIADFYDEDSANPCDEAEKSYEEAEQTAPIVEPSSTGQINIIAFSTGETLLIDVNEAEVLLDRLGWAIESVHRLNERVPF